MRAGPATLLALVAAALATAPGADGAAAVSALDAARALDGAKPAMTADGAAGIFARALERAEGDGTRKGRKNGGGRRKDGSQGKNRKDRKDRNERKGRKGNRKGKNGRGRGRGGEGGNGGLPDSGRPELGGDNSVVCGPKATFAASEEYCAALGLWVCSLAQLKSTVSTCGDTIWANRECGSAGGHLAFSTTTGTRCHDSEAKQYVQCCSI